MIWFCFFSQVNSVCFFCRFFFAFEMILIFLEFDSIHFEKHMKMKIRILRGEGKMRERPFYFPRKALRVKICKYATESAITQGRATTLTPPPPGPLRKHFLCARTSGCHMSQKKVIAQEWGADTTEHWKLDNSVIHVKNIVLPTPQNGRPIGQSRIQPFWW